MVSACFYVGLHNPIIVEISTAFGNLIDKLMEKIEKFSIRWSLTSSSLIEKFDIVKKRNSIIKSTSNKD